MPVRHFERRVGPGNGKKKKRISLFFIDSPDFFSMGLQIFLYQGLAGLKDGKNTKQISKIALERNVAGK